MISRPNINIMRNLYCQAQSQLQQSPISNCAELGPAQPQLVYCIPYKHMIDINGIIFYCNIEKNKHQWKFSMCTVWSLTDGNDRLQRKHLNFFWQCFFKCWVNFSAEMKPASQFPHLTVQLAGHFLLFLCFSKWALRSNTLWYHIG